MIRKLIFVGVVGTSLCAAPLAMAGDIQLQPMDPPSSQSPSAPQPSDTANSSSDSYQSMPLKDRVRRLERILDSQSLQDMLTRIDTLQNEVETLRGALQVQSHQLDELKQRQRDLYMDIDRRLTRLERNGTGGTSSAPASSIPPAAGTGAGGSANGNGGTNSATATTATSSNASPAVESPGEQQAYQKAFDTLRNLHYNQAVIAFRTFIAKYPNGRYAHIAQYWIAEAEYAQRKFTQAIQDYQKLIDNYPNSPKLAEAMLKIGYSQYELNDNKDAITILDELIKSYPGTTEAGQAQNLLRRIQQSQ